MPPGCHQPAQCHQCHLVVPGEPGPVLGSRGGIGASPRRVVLVGRETWSKAWISQIFRSIVVTMVIARGGEMCCWTCFAWLFRKGLVTSVCWL